MSAGGLVLTILIVFGGLAYLQLWTKAFADLLWMFALRRWLVGLITLATFLAVLGLAHALCGLAAGSPSLVLLGLLAAPPAARSLADWLAMHLARRRGNGTAEGPCALGQGKPDGEEPHREHGVASDDEALLDVPASEGPAEAQGYARDADGHHWRNFIFADTRRRQDANYEAPPIGFD